MPCVVAKNEAPLFSETLMHSDWLNKAHCFMIGQRFRACLHMELDKFGMPNFVGACTPRATRSEVLRFHKTCRKTSYRRETTKIDTKEEIIMIVKYLRF